ncbi:hypothetical protein MBSD_n0562 [Mizugakiibacter sediminis]|uniref:Uncharacterized protein n=1 Tax=Mizugakiibacter sediminis TaxID=1475481 RepID=A0A0K8QKA0_9GAMM|nr:hypothetical protein MBSD_n0562 [Mizugakiibacter sediminis]
MDMASALRRFLPLYRRQAGKLEAKREAGGGRRERRGADALKGWREPRKALDSGVRRNDPPDAMRLVSRGRLHAGSCITTR